MIAFRLSVSFLWQNKAPLGLDPEGQAVFRPLGQNQAEFAQLAVVCFWRQRKYKQLENRVPYYPYVVD